MKLLHWIIRLIKQRNKGFSESKTLKQIDEEGDHFSAEKGELGVKFGGAFDVVNSSGQWSTVVGEIQKNRYFDTFGCTVFNTENVIQILRKHKYGSFEEYTERYNGVLSNIIIGFGGSPHDSAESYRKYGALPFDKLPFNDTIKSAYQYYQPKPMTKELINEGKKWLDKWEFGHEWFWGHSHNNMMKMLKYSPIGTGVSAWYKRGDIYYQPSWANQNHWTTLIGYVEGKYWIVFDSYKKDGTFIKHLDWNYPFKFTKRYYLNKRDGAGIDKVEKGKDVFNNLKGKKYIQVANDGALYELDGFNLIYHFWATNSKTFFQKAVDEYIRKKDREGVLTGISLEDFNILKNYVILAGGEVTVDKDTIEDVKGLLNKLISK